jgi:hypothetical protein
MQKANSQMQEHAKPSRFWRRCTKALPIDPVAADLDVPLLTGTAHPNAKGEFADAGTRETVAVLATLQQRDPRLYGWVSEAGALNGDGVRLALRSPVGAEALVSAAPASLRLRELEVALADLAARGELPQLKRIDARFHDQIVVSLKGSGKGNGEGSGTGTTLLEDRARGSVKGEVVPGPHR